MENTINNIQSSPAFTSTIIPKASLGEVSKYAQELNKYFEVRGIMGSTEKMRNAIDLGQAAIGVSKDGVVIVGKDKSADKFIHRTMKEITSDVKYIDDAPEIKAEGPVLEILA